MKNRICNSLGSGYGTGKLVKKRPVHLLLPRTPSISSKCKDAKGDMGASESFFPED